MVCDGVIFMCGLQDYLRSESSLVYIILMSTKLGYFLQ